MSVIKVFNYHISTNYKKSEAKEKFEEALTNFVEDSDPDIGFNLDHFVESLTEEEEDFELLSEIDEDEADIEYTEEQIFEFVEKIVNAYEDEDGDIPEREMEENEEEE